MTAPVAPSPDLGSEVLLEVADHIATITLNAPQRMNTISGAMLDQLSEHLLAADRDRDVRCIVLTGAGRAFCAGLDLAAQMQASPGALGNMGGGTSIPGEFDIRNAPPIVLHGLDTPTICALNGGAAGYGLDLALGCDIRIAAASAKLNSGFAKRGILPESGGTWLLPRMAELGQTVEAITYQLANSNSAVWDALAKLTQHDDEAIRLKARGLQSFFHDNPDAAADFPRALADAAARYLDGTPMFPHPLTPLSKR